MARCVVFPLYKNKGDGNNCSDYRAVTLLSCMRKLFTSILKELIKVFTYTYEVIKENLAGFRHEYSNLDHIFLLKSVVDLFRWKKEKLFCLFVDYAKASDMAWKEG